MSSDADPICPAGGQLFHSGAEGGPPPREGQLSAEDPPAARGDPPAPENQQKNGMRGGQVAPLSGTGDRPGKISDFAAAPEHGSEGAGVGAFSLAGSRQSFQDTLSSQSFQDTLSCLKFIASVRKDEKIDVASRSVQPDNLAGSLYRTFIARGEGRRATFEFIQKTFDTAFAAMAEYSSSPDPLHVAFAGMLRAAIIGARGGVQSLLVTYSADRNFVSQLESLLDTLDAKML